MSVAQRDVLRHLVASARVATVLVVLAALAVAAACEEGPEPAPSPTAATTATPGPTTPTATTGPTVVATPPVTSTPQTTPTASPTATATPTPSPTPAPRPDIPAPEPRDALDLIKSAPDAFEHRTFESGETIDWHHGIFVLDPVTGLTDGYRVRGAEALHYIKHFPGGWIKSCDLIGRTVCSYIGRGTGRSWRWCEASSAARGRWPGSCCSRKCSRIAESRDPAHVDAPRCKRSLDSRLTCLVTVEDGVVSRRINRSLAISGAMARSVYLVSVGSLSRHPRVPPQPPKTRPPERGRLPAWRSSPARTDLHPRRSSQRGWE